MVGWWADEKSVPWRGVPTSTHCHPAQAGCAMLTFPAHPVGGPIVGVEVGWLRGLDHQVLHVPPCEVLTVEKGARPGVQCQGGAEWPQSPISNKNSLGFQGERDDACRQRGRGRGARVRLCALLSKVSGHLQKDPGLSS